MVIFRAENIGIVTNPKRDSDFSKTKEIIRIVEKLGKTAVLPHGSSEQIEQDFFDKSDAIITLGGDGTILSIAENAALTNIPIMGINIGHMGYLTACGFDDAEASLRIMFDGTYVSEKRMMLKAQIVSGKAGVVVHRCLNDVCIVRGTTSKIIRFDLFINGDFVDNYNADGIILSTPTGSTAYNLSAGGPILNPNAEMIAITPICPHMITTRPIVVSSFDKIAVKIKSQTKETVVSVDGKEPSLLNFDDIVNIEKSEKSVEIIKTNKMSFYDVLRNKILGMNPVDF